MNERHKAQGTGHKQGTSNKNPDVNPGEQDSVHRESEIKNADEHFENKSEANEKITDQPPPQTTHMETHAHHLHKAPGKNFWHYFFEFIMLFLAVFCGFLAENFREEFIDHRREKQYIRMFIEDLKSDTAAITANLNWKLQKKQGNDSLIFYLNSADPNQYGQRIYFYARQLTRTTNFLPADRTMKQLKNSGGLRLIKNQQVSDSIMSYDQSLDRILLAQTRQENEIIEIRPMMGRLMDARILETMIEGEEIRPPLNNPALRTTNKEFILDFIYAVHQLKGSSEVVGARLIRLKEKAINMIQFLQKEYDVE